MKKETKVSVYNLGGQPAGEINPEEIEYSENDPAQPTSRRLSGSDDHWAAEEWVQDAIMPDGRKCQVFYLFSADEIADDDGQPIDADNYPWDADHISRVVLDDIVEISDVIDRAGGQTKLARLHGIPLRTVQNWASGDRKPPAWLIKILDKITK